jgi:Fe-Mn family superoxide dismutase
MAEYSLPDLRYDYGALEPHISGRIMELHHDKHHGGYVKGANTTLEKLAEARDKENFTQLGALEKALAFNLSGHVLHSLFWQNLTPKGGERPSGELGEAIKRDFGSFEKFKKQLTEAASTIMGSGWGALVWEPLGQRLLTVQIYDHQSNIAQAGMPLLVLDAGARLYLQYENRDRLLQSSGMLELEGRRERFDAVRESAWKSSALQ